MRVREVIAAALVIVAMGLAARPRPRPSATVADLSPDSEMQVHAPAPVMSLLRRACFDCHSDKTRWPWYAALPLASHFVERDVAAGRGQLNWSQWEHYNPFDRAGLLDKACELASMHTMPPRPYRIMHAEARLSAADVSELCAWTRVEAMRLVQVGG